MPTFKDLTNQAFGSWMVCYLYQIRAGKAFWWCRCACGTERVVDGANLRSHLTKSCGCGVLKRFHKIEHSTPEQRQMSEWIVYCSMINRCTNPNNSGWKNYGGRGIRVCERWVSSFQYFLNDVGPRPSLRHTLERKDNSKGYEPENVIWLPRGKQNRNRRDNRIITYNGKSQCVAAWAEELGWPYMRLIGRLNSGKPLHDIFSPEERLPRVRKKFVSNAYITLNGVTQTVYEWSEQLGIPVRTIKSRKRAGDSPERCLRTTR